MDKIIQKINTEAIKEINVIINELVSNALDKPAPNISLILSAQIVEGFHNMLTEQGFEIKEKCKHKRVSQSPHSREIVCNDCGARAPDH